MVVKIMRWRPWPPLISRKYEVKLNVKRLEGGDWMHEGAEKDNGGLAVEIRWKGHKISLGSFRRTVKRNCTREGIVKRVDGPNGGVLVEWDEEFHSVCSLSGHKENVFHPWEINFNILHVLTLDLSLYLLLFGRIAIGREGGVPPLIALARSDAEGNHISFLYLSVTNHIPTLLFLGFGLWSLWNAFHERCLNSQGYLRLMDYNLEVVLLS